MEICFFWSDRLRDCVDSLQALGRPHAADMGRKATISLHHGPPKNTNTNSIFLINSDLVQLDHAYP